MHFYYVTTKKLDAFYVHPEEVFEIPRLANQKYIPVTRSLHEGCQLNYLKIKKELDEKGYAKLYSYKLNLNTKMLEQMYTPERITYENINASSSLVNECRLSFSSKLFFNGEIIVLKPHVDSLKYMLTYKEGDENKILSPNFLDYYLIRNTFSNDTSPFATRKLYPQHTTENRFLSPEYEDLCLKYAMSTDDLVPLMMQRGIKIGEKSFPPCVTFVNTALGEELKDAIFNELCMLAPRYGLNIQSIKTSKATATFFKKDYDHLGNIAKTSSYKHQVNNIFFKDLDILENPAQLEDFKNAFTEASSNILK